MGSILASAMISKARVELLDPTPGDTFSDAVLLGFLNSAERAACVLRPELFTVVGDIPLVAGIEQALPTGGTALMTIYRNKLSGRAVRLVVEQLNDIVNPLWAAATPEDDVQEYMVDGRDRTRFRVLPPNTGAETVLVGLYGLVPPERTTGQPINLDDVYEMPLFHLMCAQAYGANTKRGDVAKESFHYNRAAQLLGVNAQSLAALLPKLMTDGNA